LATTWPIAVVGDPSAATRCDIVSFHSVGYHLLICNRLASLFAILCRCPSFHAPLIEFLVSSFVITEVYFADW
jgi:hypothetical protein